MCTGLTVESVLKIIEDVRKPIGEWVSDIEQNLGSDEDNELWRLSCLDRGCEEVNFRHLSNAAYIWNAVRWVELDSIRTALKGLIAEAARLEPYSRDEVKLEGEVFRFADLVKH